MQSSYWVAAALPLLVATFSPPALGADNQVLRQFGAGSGSSALGIVEARPDVEVEGPQAIASGDNGEIYLLDQVNSRVISFDAKSPDGPTRSLALPRDIDPSDMLVSGGNIYLWDGKPIKLNTSGTGATRSLVPGPATSDDVDEATSSMFGQMGGTAVEATTEGPATRTIGGGKSPPAAPPAAVAAQQARAEGRQMLVTRGKGQVVATVVADKGDTSATITVTPKSGGALPKMLVKVRDKLGTIEVLDIDLDGKTYVLTENVPTSGRAASFVVRFGRNGGLEGVYEMPLTPDMALSRRFVTVTPEGEVYFMRTRKDVVDVLGVGFRAMNKDQVVDLSIEDPNASAFLGAPGGPVIIQPIAAIRLLTRAQIMQTAASFADVRWRVTNTAYGNDPNVGCTGFGNRGRRPMYLVGKAGQEVQGIPYCWGCHGQLPTIATMINKGTLAGNVCTRNDPRPGVAGVDCSAFVSATWGLQAHFTTVAIPAITNPIPNPWDMKPGDAFNKPGSHVMLFAGFTADRKAAVIESSTGGCGGKVCRNVYPLSSLLARGYVPRRYRAIVEQAQAAPVAVQPAKVGGKRKGKSA